MPGDPAIRNQLGRMEMVCGQRPAFIPTLVSSEQREASQMYFAIPSFSLLRGQTVSETGMVMKIVPAGATIAELEKKAAEFEEKAKTEPDRIATRLTEKAKLCREWIAALKSRKWMF
jgi:hypothetical protein